MNIRLVALALALVACALPIGTPSIAQMSAAGAATASPDTGYLFSGSLRLRLEDYNWFTTPKANGAYTFLGAEARGAITRQTGKEEIFLEFEAPALVNLPTMATATAPQGALGQGANYRAANGNQVATFFIRQGYVRFKHVGAPGNSVRLGRFEFSDGGETTAADPTLNYLKQNRISQRLIGPFNYTHVGRSFDGLQFAKNQPQQNVTAMFAFPTRGVFDLNGWDTLTDIPIAYLAATNVHPGAKASGEERLFAIYYGDSRPGVVKTDNRPLAVRTADKQGINIGTFGAHYVRTTQLGSGRLDGLLWAAGQIGQWGKQKQGAYAFDAEAGYQLPGGIKSWLRVGYSLFSGDGNTVNSQHGTFIPLLPTPRTYARFPFFTEANLQDAFAQLVLRPGNRLTLRTDVHDLRLANSHDLWYTGGGAYDNSTFGYTGRTSNGKSTLGTLYDLSADYQLSKHASFTFYLAYMHGGDVVGKIYSGKDAVFSYVEATQRF